MQRIQDLVRTGHTQYVQGTIPIQKASGLAAKFNERYSVGANRMAASRARRSGDGSARLLMYFPGERELIHWILLRTPTTTPDDSEKWRDALFDKMRIEFTGYQLVRRVRPVTSAEKASIFRLRTALNSQDLTEEDRAKVQKSLANLEASGKQRLAWTWAYSRDQYHALRDAVQLAIRQKKDDQLNQLIHSLSRTPGFAGAREQVNQIWKLVKGEWARSMSGDQQPPELPKVGFVRRLSDQGKPLPRLISEISRQAKRVADKPL